MTRRNFILLIIILVVVAMVVFAFMFFQESPTTPNEPGTGINFGSIFNPFGIGTTTPKPNPKIEPELPPTPEPEVIIKLQKVSSMPIAGFVVFSKERLIDIPIVVIDPTLTLPLAGEGKNTKTAAKPTAPPTEFVPALRYVERATGNIYQTFADKIEEKKFSGTVIPKIYEAFFGNKGETVVMRYLKTDNRTIETFTSNLPKELLGGDTTDNNEIKGSFLPENIKDISLSPDSGNLFYLFNSGDNMVGTTINLTTNKKVQIFSSPFTEWLSFWPNSKTITLTTKPASGIPGYMYAISLSTKAFGKVLSGINGLTTLESLDGKMVLYANDNLTLSIYHLDTKTSVLLGVKTLPDKCVWNKLSDFIYCAVPKILNPVQYPDAWYQGEVSFSDQIWKIDVKTGNATIIIDPIEINGGEEIDGIKLAIDEGENYLFFVNKKDSYLWELGLK